MGAHECRRSIEGAIFPAVFSLLQSGSSSNANNAIRRACNGKAEDESISYVAGLKTREDDREAIVYVDQ